MMRVVVVVVKRGLLDGGGLVAAAAAGVGVGDGEVVVVIAAAAAARQGLRVLVFRAEVRVFELLGGLQRLPVHPCLDDR